MISDPRWQRSKEENAILSKVGGEFEGVGDLSPYSLSSLSNVEEEKVPMEDEGSDGVACGLVTG